MTISKKAAKEIAALYNKILVGEMMLKGGHTFELWNDQIVEAVSTLREKYGIAVVGY